MGERKKDQQSGDDQARATRALRRKTEGADRGGLTLQRGDESQRTEDAKSAQGANIDGVASQLIEHKAQETVTRERWCERAWLDVRIAACGMPSRTPVAG